MIKGSLFYTGLTLFIITLIPIGLFIKEKDNRKSMFEKYEPLKPNVHLDYDPESENIKKELKEYFNN